MKQVKGKDLVEKSIVRLDEDVVLLLIMDLGAPTFLVVAACGNYNNATVTFEKNKEYKVYQSAQELKDDIALYDLAT